MSYVGECNSCGVCCSYAGYACEHLLQFDKLGNPGASACSIWDKRTYGMLIVMRNTRGEKAYSKCITVYPRPQDAVPPQCSYVWDGQERKQPLWHITYAPKLEEEVCTSDAVSTQTIEGKDTQP